jgi:uncharacterized protein (TIGR02453 family)
MVVPFPGFSDAALSFLRQLRRHNNREWFLAHRDTYESEVRGPMVELVTALGAALQVLTPEMETDPRRSIYRIHRDTRFSADKSPYKTRVAAVFWPRGLQKHSCASLYFHVSPEEVLIGGGIYMAAPPDLRAIRRHIASHWEELNGLIRNRRFRKLFGELEGDQLARVPREFPAGHPAADLLRLKQYLAFALDRPDLAASPKLFARIVTLFAAMIPLVRFLNRPAQDEAAAGRRAAEAGLR